MLSIEYWSDFLIIFFQKIYSLQNFTLSHQQTSEPTNWFLKKKVNIFQISKNLQTQKKFQIIFM